MIKKSLISSLVGAILLQVPLAHASTFSHSDEIVMGFHEKTRTNVYPNQHTLVLNPTAFIWPQPKKGEHPLYRVNISATNGSTTLQSDWMAWAAWRPQQTLAAGEYQWYLQKRINGETTQQGPFKFTVPEGLAEYAPPIQSATELDAILAQKPHPRFFQLNGTQAQIAKRIPAQLRQTILTNAELFLAKEESKDHFADVNYDLKPHEIKRQKINRAKILLNHLRLKVLYLAQAYVLTNDEKYVAAAKEKYQSFQSVDTNNFTLNDFTAGMALDTTLYLLDGFYEHWSPAQRKALIDFSAKIAQHEYEHHQYRLESQFFDNHTWQKGIALLTRSALILGQHVPQASQWLSYVQSVWSARAPAAGFNLDGGWGNGNSYMTANIVSLIQVPMILNQLNGFNYLSHPWYQALPKAMITTYQPNSYSNGFGDGHDSKTMPIWVRGQLAEYVARGLGDGRLTWYRDQLFTMPRGKAPTVYGAGDKHPLDSEAHQWLISSMKAPLPKAMQPDYPNAAAFADTGVVSMHNDITSAKGNVHVAFRSSPYGTGSHTTNNQNSFNIIVNGKPLFLASGYYTNFSDKHNLLHYRHTRGHNTVLVNGLGQDIGMHAVGQVKRFATSKGLSYTMGDASTAYQGVLKDPMWIQKMAQSGVDFSEQNGYGKSPLTRFQRHIIKMGQQAVVIVDELAASEPSQFSWLLHTPGKFSLNGDKLTATIEGAKADVYLAASTSLSNTITDEFASPAINWSGKKVNGKLLQYPKQHHFTANTQKSDRAIIVALIAIDPSEKGLPEVKPLQPGAWQVGDYQLTVNLDSERPLAIDVQGGEHQSSLKVTQTSATLTEAGQPIKVQQFNPVQTF